MIDDALSSDLSISLSSGAAPAFELQFSMLQNTMIRRLNKEIDVIVNADADKRKLDSLSKEYDKLLAGRPLIDRYTEINVGNQEKLASMTETNSSMIAAFSAEDDDTNLTANELASFEAARATVLEQIDSLAYVVHPDIVVPDMIHQVSNMRDTIANMTLVVGAVDPEGSGSPTNDNRTNLDLLRTFQTLVSTALTVTSGVIEDVNEMSYAITKKMTANQTERIDMLAVQAKEKSAKVEALKEQYGNLLQAISATFEVNKEFASGLSNSLLHGGVVSPGTVMDLFA